MPTTTRARRSPAAGTRRFSGPAMNARRHAAPQRRGIAGGWLQRRQPKPSTMQRIMGAMPGRKGAGGLAALAGAAGLAFKKRDRLASMMRRNDHAAKG
jgi:hypothetical protein